ncbi:hypothetical protein [Myroides odoratimimus]|uniref:hypothetical protein n=1 Tax=Myroides odoratimimus TaxID=76832 RepID=UPI00046ADF48|nr:hypothetical protein [Myroides odoratimimus]
MGKKKIHKVIQYGLLCTVLFSQNFYAQFPYFNTAQSSSDFKVIGVGGKKSSNSYDNHEVLFNSNGLMLIDDVNQYAAVSLESLSFNTDKGFVLEFEFALDAGSMFEGKYGDGISMILYDASQKDAKPGDKGGALGYAYTKQESGSGVNGFTKGFLGLGLDLFGNYKNIMSNKNEIRNGIVSNNSGGNFVVLRGPYSTESTTEGYPVLFAIGTKYNQNYYLDRTNGNVDIKQKGLQGQRFSLRGNKLTAKPGDSEYRKAVISLVPGKDIMSNEVGFFISVDMVNGVYTSSVIKNYFIPKKGNITYNEQVGKTSSSKRILAIETPTELKMAFAGSTGGAAIRAHIRNILLALPFSPIVNDISIQQVLIDRTTVIKPLNSAFGYNSNVYSILSPPIKSILYLDKTAFRFKRFNPNTKQLELTSDPYVLDEPTVGVFKYDKDSGEITFTPAEEFQGGGAYTFYYDIKNLKPSSGIDISTEEYRSRAASVTLNFVDAGQLIDQFYPYLIINRGMKNVKDPKTVR